MIFLMIFDFTQFWLDGRPGNEYFWISHKISGHLTPMTPLDVHPQWFETTWNRYKQFLLMWGKSFSEALILASINPQYDKRLFIELHFQHMKQKIANLEHVLYKIYLFLFLFWYSEQFDAKIRGSDQDLPVLCVIVTQYNN